MRSTKYPCRPMHTHAQNVLQDKTGDVGWDEFLVVMTETMAQLGEKREGSCGKVKPGNGGAATSDANDNAYQLPFGLMATQYQRKKYMSSLMNGSREGIAQMVSPSTDVQESASTTW